MKKSMQWDIVGVFSLIMLLVSWFSGSTSYGFYALGSPILMVIFLCFTFMSFGFGFLESRRENPIK
jgi:polyferredoxin